MICETEFSGRIDVRYQAANSTGQRNTF